MGILTALLQIILVITSILLVLVILLQKNKGAGAGVTFGGMGEAVFGAEMGNILTRTTIVLGSVFIVVVIALSIITSRTNTNSIGSYMDNVRVEPPAAVIPQTTEADVAKDAPVAPDAAAADEVLAPATEVAPAETPAVEVTAPDAAPAATEAKE